MSHAYAIELGNEVIGIAVRQDGEQGYRFHAALPRYYPIDGLSFPRPAEIQIAAAALQPAPFKPKDHRTQPVHEPVLAAN